MKKVFISGSISIKKLPKEVCKKIDSIIKEGFPIILGDAKGVDIEIQKYCKEKKYFNVTVFHIGLDPRNLASEKFQREHIQVSDNLKKREHQMKKDEAMTTECNYTLVVWDGKSKGSYSNIIRSLKEHKQTQVFLNSENRYLQQKEVTMDGINYIYRENVGYTTEETIEQLKEYNVTTKFNKPKELYNYLLKKVIIKKKDNIYLPAKDHSDLFYIQEYKGKQVGIRFRNQFINWLESELKEEQVCDKVKEKNLIQQELSL